MATTWRDIAFFGERSAEGLATCAQRHMWNLVQRQMPDSTFYNQIYCVKLPQGSTLANTLHVLGELISRYESLRTVYRSGAAGELRQQVLRSGYLTAEIVSVDDVADAENAIASLEQRMRGIGFDHTEELPIRGAIVQWDSEPLYGVFCVSHMAADLTALRLFEAEIIRLLSARAHGQTAGPPPQFRQPLEQAAFEESDRGQQVLARANTYWSRQLAGAPLSMLPQSALGPEPASPQFYSAIMDSRAVALALRVLAARYLASSSAILLATVSLLLGRRSGISRCTLRLLAANRTDRALRGTVANLHQEVPVTVDLTGETVSDVIRAARSAALNAYANGLYNPGQVDRIWQTHERGRGERIDLSCCFNDARVHHNDRLRPERITPEDIRSATAETTIKRGEFVEAESFFLVVHDDLVVRSDGPERIGIVLGADPRVLPTEAVHGFLAGIERLLIALTEREVPLAEVDAVSGVTAAVDARNRPLADV